MSSPPSGRSLADADDAGSIAGSIGLAVAVRLTLGSAALRASSAVREVSAVDDVAVLDERPLVLFGHRVYTQRQWVDECTVAMAVRRRARSIVDADGVDDGARPPAAASRSTALPTPNTSRRHECVGGLLTLIARRAGDRQDAHRGQPAGRRARRIGRPPGPPGGAHRQGGEPAHRGRCGHRAHRAASRATSTPTVVDQLLGLQATTVHRLLGGRPDSRTRFRHDADNPLDADLVVVDETSMLALPLMARLLAAVPEHCRLVLVGDPDQLRSIEVGTVLADLVAAGQPGGPLAGDVVRLVGQHRTGEGSPIGPLAESIRRGDADDVVDLLRAGGDDRLRFVEVTDGLVPPSADRRRARRRRAGVSPRPARPPSPRTGLVAFAAAGSARILCGHRRGPFGVATWNDVSRGHELPGTTPAASVRRTRAGRPLLATRNDPRTGTVERRPGRARAGGSSPRGRCSAAAVSCVTFDLAELDAVETAYALTVHKSQGSEYDTVAVVHPPADSPLVSRELLYTAVTRAAGAARRRRLGRVDPPGGAHARLDGSPASPTPSAAGP